jgi:hypothetical protein
MQGVPFRVDGGGRVLISWMSRNKAYWSFSDRTTKRFAPRIAAPDGRKEDAAFPMAVANATGQVLLVWMHGLTVQWALYRQDGSFTGEQGRAGELRGGHKPTAFAAPDGHFYIVF